MNTETTPQKGFPPRWLIGVAATVIVIAGITIGVSQANRGDGPPPAVSPTTSGQSDGISQPGTTPAATTADPATPAPPPTPDLDASLCGLDGGQPGAAVAMPADITWPTQGGTAYPSAPTIGPGLTSPEGFRHCFEHSTTGAVFAAANAVVQAVEADANDNDAWFDYIVAEGPLREAALARDPDSFADIPSGAALSIVGYRLLAADQTTAQVDIAVRGSLFGFSVHVSVVLDLVWQRGDWRVEVTDPERLIAVSTIPDTSGYTPWGP